MLPKQMNQLFSGLHFGRLIPGLYLTEESNYLSLDTPSGHAYNPSIEEAEAGESRVQH
jgi:hypothetical protein